MQMKLNWLIIVAIVAFAAYVRFAPSNPGHWHIDPIVSSERMGYGILVEMPADLADLDAAVMSSPRVRVLAGSVQDRHITYVARSKFWGFPDYISVKQVGSNLTVWIPLQCGHPSPPVQIAAAALKHRFKLKTKMTMMDNILRFITVILKSSCKFKCSDIITHLKRRVNNYTTMWLSVFVNQPVHCLQMAVRSIYYL